MRGRVGVKAWRVPATRRRPRRGVRGRAGLVAAAGRTVHVTDDHEAGEDKTPNSTRVAIHLSRHVAAVKQEV